MMIVVNKENVLIYKEHRYQDVNVIVISDGMDHTATKVRLSNLMLNTFYNILDAKNN